MEHPIIIDSGGKIGPRGRSVYQNLMQQFIQKARDEIMAQKDAEIFKALDSAFDINYGNNKE